MSHLKVSSVFNELRGVTPEGGQDKRLELIQRIVSSNHFQRSIRLRDFFLYVTERALSNHPEGVTEHEVGCRVFGRRADYEPSEDNIVRVSARQLRAKLKEYFDTDGQDEEWIVEIPKGGYLPVFRLRERPPATSAPEPPTAPRSSWLLPVIVLLFLSLAFNVLFWRMRVESPAGIGTPRPPSNFIVALFGNSPRITHVVLSDAALVLMQGVVGHRFSLEEYADGSYVTMPWRQARVPWSRQFGTR